jgi:hypothetical protein
MSKVVIIEGLKMKGENVSKWGLREQGVGKLWRNKR